jgi:hypothetical protein
MAASRAWQSFGHPVTLLCCLLAIDLHQERSGWPIRTFSFLLHIITLSVILTTNSNNIQPDQGNEQ